MYDFSDVEPQQSSDLIPDGTFAKITMTIRRGGVDGQDETDRGLLKASTTPGSDVLSLDCEFTVVDGRHARRKFWHNFTVAGGKVDEKGASIGWNISKRGFRAMIDSALGLDPDDNSEEAKAKRRLRGLADLDGISFVAKIAVEPNNDPRYPDKNKLDRPVLPNEKEWREVMNGEEVAPSPSRPRSANGGAGGAVTAPKPAWGQQPAAHAQQTTFTPRAAVAPWQQPVTTQLGQNTGDGQPAKPTGPAWLNP
jgi:hypothetical protein